MLGRTLALAAVVICGLAVAVPGWVALHPDLAAPGDADLELELTGASRLATGHPLFEAAARAVDVPGEEAVLERLARARRAAASDADWVGGLVARNREAFELLRALLAAPLLQFPGDLDPDSIRSRMELHLALQQLIRLAGAQAQVELGRGDVESALEWATLGVRLGRTVSSGENIDLLDMLMAASTAAIALADVERIVRAEPPPPALARDLVARLEAGRWTPADWERVWAFEYQFVKASFLELGAQGADATAIEDAGLPDWVARLVPFEYLWQPNRTLSLLSEAYREQVPKSAASCAEAGLDLGAPGEQGAPLSALLRPNAAGRILVGIADPNFDRFQLRRCELDTRISLVQVLVALQAHRRAEGRLPETLGALVPDFLPEVPRDGYDGRPLRYSRARARAWSIGEDLEDSRGEQPTGAGRSAEPTLTFGS